IHPTSAISVVSSFNSTLDIRNTNRAAPLTRQIAISRRKLPKSPLKKTISKKPFDHVGQIAFSNIDETNRVEDNAAQLETFMEETLRFRKDFEPEVRPCEKAPRRCNTFFYSFLSLRQFALNHCKGQFSGSPGPLPNNSHTMLTAFVYST